MSQWTVRAMLICGIAVLAGCHGILDVSDPTRVQDSDIANPAGANSRRLYAVFNFNRAITQSAVDVALFTDEQTIDGQGSSYDIDLSRRDGPGYEASNTATNSQSTQDPHLGQWDAVVTAVDVALPTVRAYTPDSLKGDFLAQLFALNGYAIVQMAEDICSGFPINHVTTENEPLFTPPFTTDSALMYGITQADSALKYVKDTTRFRYLAQVTKGRGLLDLGQYAAAAEAVSGVPTTFTYLSEGNNSAYTDPMRYDYGYDNRVISDSEGVNGLPFISAHDPRVTSVAVGVSYFNAVDSAYFSTKYSGYSDPMVVASGTEARLIEAEAALSSGSSDWLTILNTLRESIGLADLTDPGITTAQVNLLYHERAFWLYLTGRRLGDMRRLMRNYGRDPNTVFPIGGTQRSSTAIPFVFATEKVHNPFLTSGCTEP